jgi:hypothetical protein
VIAEQLLEVMCAQVVLEMVRRKVIVRAVRQPGRGGSLPRLFAIELLLLLLLEQSKE